MAHSRAQVACAGIAKTRLSTGVADEAVREERKAAEQEWTEKIQAHAQLEEQELAESASLAWRIAHNKIFENLTFLVISLNAIWIGVDLENNHASIWMEADPIFQFADNFFCGFFTFEVVVRFLACKRKLEFWKDKPFVFDLFLVLLMIFETWVFAIVAAVGDAKSGALPNLSVLRLLRLLRLTRMMRLMRFMPELLTIVKGLVAGLRSVGVTFILLLGMTWVFAIIFCLQYRDAEGLLYDEYFSRIGISMVTLFVNGTLLDEFTSVALALLEDSPIMLVVFLIFVSGSALTVLNMLIGTLADAVSKTDRAEKEALVFHEMSEVLKEVFVGSDTDGNQKISAIEFLELMSGQNSPVANALMLLGIREDRLWDVWREVFEIDDEQFKTNEAMDMVAEPDAGGGGGSPDASASSRSIEVAVNSGKLTGNRHSRELEVVNSDVKDMNVKKELTFKEFMDEISCLHPNNTICVRDLCTLRRSVWKMTNLMDTGITDALKELKLVAATSSATVAASSTSTGTARSAPSSTATARSAQSPQLSPRAAGRPAAPTAWGPDSQSIVAEPDRRRRKLSVVPTSMLLDELSQRLEPVTTPRHCRLIS